MPTIAVTIVDQTVAVTQAGEIGPAGATGATGTVSAAGDGTAGAPGIAFASDTNTGLFRPGADILAASTGGTEKMRITSAGDVGIGTTSPTSGVKLDVVGALKVGTGVAASSGQLLINSTSGAGATLQLFQDSVESWTVSNPASSTRLAFSASGSERMTILTGGNVGIGTSSPGAPLDIRGANGLGVRYLETTTGNTNRIELGTGSGFGYVAATCGSGSTALAFQVAGTEQARIDSSGNVTPGADNTQNFGSGSLRWATIYAGTGTINTSDERYKVLREGGDLTDAEFAAWSNVRAIVYQDKDAFDRKGSAARLHIGYSWQSIQAAFEAEGLDAGRYGLWCEDALEAPVEKTRMVSRLVEGQTETVPVLDDDGEPVFEQVQETEEVEQPFEEVRMIDGAPVLVKGVRTVAQPVFDSVQIRDEDGEMLFEMVQAKDPETGEALFDSIPALDEDGEPIFDTVQDIDPETGELIFDQPDPVEDPETGEPVEGDPVPRMIERPRMTQAPQMVPSPRMAPVPRMISKAKTETVPVMEEVEETFTEMEPTGETRGALRYNQCSVIEAAWLRRELASIVARLSALEAA